MQQLVHTDVAETGTCTIFLRMLKCLYGQNELCVNESQAICVHVPIRIESTIFAKRDGGQNVNASSQVFIRLRTGRGRNIVDGHFTNA